jgi:hypothetical protein
LHHSCHVGLRPLFEELGLVAPETFGFRAADSDSEHDWAGIIDRRLAKSAEPWNDVASRLASVARAILGRFDLADAIGPYHNHVARSFKPLNPP